MITAEINYNNMLSLLRMFHYFRRFLFTCNDIIPETNNNQSDYHWIYDIMPTFCLLISITIRVKITPPNVNEPMLKTNCTLTNLIYEAVICKRHNYDIDDCPINPEDTSDNHFCELCSQSNHSLPWTEKDETYFISFKNYLTREGCNILENDNYFLNYFSKLALQSVLHYCCLYEFPFGHFHFLIFRHVHRLCSMVNKNVTNSGFPEIDRCKFYISHKLSLCPNNKPPQDEPILQARCTEIIRFILGQIPDKNIAFGFDVTPKELCKAIMRQKRRGQRKLFLLSKFLGLFDTTNTVNEAKKIWPHLLNGFNHTFVMQQEMFLSINYLQFLETIPSNHMRRIRKKMHILFNLLINKIKSGVDELLEFSLILTLTFYYTPQDLILISNSNILDYLINIDRDREQSWKAISKLISSITLLTYSYCYQLPINVSKNIVRVLYNYVKIKLYSDNDSDLLTNNIEQERQLLPVTSNKDFNEILSNLFTSTSQPIMRSHLGTMNWLKLFLIICKSLHSLEIRVMTLKIIYNIFPFVSHDETEAREIIQLIFNAMSSEMWIYPEARSKYNLITTPKNEFTPVFPEIKFDASRSYACNVENNLCIHNLTGRAFTLGNVPMKNGLYRWSIIIESSEGTLSEGVMIGVSLKCLRDIYHRSTSEMWLYRGINGGLYHEGKLPISFPTFTCGDIITVELDMDARTLAFGKNGELPKVAFTKISADEVYPCVAFSLYNHGEKVIFSFY